VNYDDLIRKAVNDHLQAGFDWRIFKAQIKAESNFNPTAVSQAGAAGLCQFMPKTWTQWASIAGYPNAKRTDPEPSIMTGACYMAYLMDIWSWPRPEMDRICLALASYNAGHGHILKAQKLSGGKSLYLDIIKELPKVTGQSSKETITYVKKILAFWTAEITG